MKVRFDLESNVYLFAVWNDFVDKHSIEAGRRGTSWPLLTMAVPC